MLYAQVTQEWVKRYNGTANSFDISTNLVIDQSGNIIVCGAASNSGFYTDISVLKYSPSGTELWTAVYNGPGNGSDQANDSYIDNSGNIYITGYITDSAFHSRISVLKINTSGSIEWIRTFAPPAYSNGFGRSITISGTGNIYAAGFAIAANGYYDIVTVKYSASGSLLASAVYDGVSGRDDNGYSICTDYQGNIHVLGVTKQLPEDNIVMLKYSPSLDPLDTVIISGSAPGDDKSVKITGYGSSMYICASLFNFASDYDIALLKYTVNGNFVWQKKFNGSGNHQDLAFDMAEENGNIFITGSSRNADTLGSEDIATLKIDTAGNVVWQKVFDGAGHGNDQGISVCADSEGSCYVGGSVDRGGYRVMFGVLKYNLSGELVWYKNYSVANLPEDFVSSIAVDKNKNVFVTGISFDTLTDYDIATIKYSQPIGIIKSASGVPVNYRLYQNFPNPFNPITKIRFDVPETGKIKLAVYDVIGREAAILVNEYLEAGYYEAEFNAWPYSSGVYFYRIEASAFSQVRKMVIIK